MIYLFTERYFWDSTKHGPNLSLVEDQPDTVRRGVARQHTDGARGSVGYNNGRHTFKFTFNDKPWGSHCAIGVCSQQSKLSLKGIVPAQIKIVIHFELDIKFKV